MGNNIHLKRYSVLDELKKALSGEKIKSPGIAVLEDGSVYYDQELKRIWPDYKINTGSYNYDEPTPEPEPEIPTEFSIDKEFYYIPLNDSYINLNIKSNKPWTCEYDSSVCSVSPSKANGNKGIEIYCYSCEESRDINISFYVENEKVAEFPIYQYSYEDTPLTFEVLSRGQIYYGCSSEYTYDDTIQYSINGKSWKTSNSVQEGIYINVNSNDKVFIKGNNKNPKDYNIYTYFGNSTASYNIYGNIGSLFGNDWNNYMYNFCCSNLFNSNNSLISAENLILPATLLLRNCYYAMFEYCNNLITPPNLLATRLAIECYSSMFYNCASLVNAPELPATTLASSCYQGMFTDCTSLTIPPELSATTLAWFCYGGMFRNCTSLTTAPSLPVMTLVEGCYSDMFNGCTSLTTAPELPATTLETSCYSNMFKGCTSLTTAPELPATILANRCYYEMFNNCTALVNVPKILPATNLSDSCYYGMFKTCSNLVKAPELPALSLVRYCYYDMFSFCSKLNYVKCLAVDISAKYCLNGFNNTNDTSISDIYERGGWIYYVSSSGTFIKNPICTSWTRGIKGIPTNWEVIDEYSNNTCQLILDIKTSGTLSFNLLDYANNGYSQQEMNYYHHYLTDIEYSLDGINWINYSTSISLSFNSKLYLRKLSYNSSFEIAPYISTTCEFNIIGNYGHPYLFKNCSTLKSAQNLKLTDNNTEEQYVGLFFNCTALTIAPDLSSLNSRVGLCQYMFYNCNSLTNPPQMPKYVENSQKCYSYMFYGCSSLTSVPTLELTNLGGGELSHMFENCTSITDASNIKIISIDTTANINPNGICDSMFKGCTSLEIGPQLLASTLSNRCYINMFNGCTNLTSAPDLMATKLAESCYQNMFNNCTNLNHILCLAIDISANNCLYNWVNNVSSSGLFIKNPYMTSWTIGTSGIPENWEIEDAPYENIPLTFEILEDGIIRWTSKNEIGGWYSYMGVFDIYYSLNNSDWILISNNRNITNSYTDINVQSGDIIRFKGNNNYYGWSRNNSSTKYYSNFSGTTAKFNVSGNIMSLLYGDDFMGKTNLGSDSNKYNDILYKFYDLFATTKVISAENLILPSTTLTYGCYQYMFSGCTSLITAPKLPATTLAGYCYNCMFYGCISLTTAPALPATTLVSSCYSNMFRNCTSLTTTPILPATILSDYCYSNMFQGCTSLTTALELPATTLVAYCYKEMFKGCTSLTTAPELPATTLATYCYSNMFNGCTSLTTAPELPATTLSTYCYYSMFYECRALTTAPDLLVANASASGCYKYMFYGCSSLNYIRCLATNIKTSDSVNSWVDGVSATGTFIKDPNMSSWTSGVSGIPSGWDVYTYENIYYGDTSEHYINGKFNLDRSSNTEYITVYSPVNSWTITNTNNWITLSQSSGNKGIIEVRIDIDSSSVDREGELILEDTDNNSYTIVIKQSEIVVIQDYQLSSNEYIDVGIINPNNITGSYNYSKYGYLSITFNTASLNLGQNIILKNITTSKKYHFDNLGNFLENNTTIPESNERYGNIINDTYVKLTLEKNDQWSENNGFWIKTSSTKDDVVHYRSNVNTAPTFNMSTDHWIIGNNDNTASSITNPIRYIEICPNDSEYTPPLKYYPYLNTSTNKCFFASEDTQNILEVKSY